MLIEEKLSIDEKLRKLEEELKHLNEELKSLKKRRALGDNCKEDLELHKSQVDEIKDQLEGLETVRIELEEKINTLLREKAEKILKQKQKALSKLIEEARDFENKIWKEFKKTYAKLELLSVALGKGDPLDYIQTCRMLPKSQMHYLPAMSRAFWEQELPKEEWPSKFKEDYKREIEELSYFVEKGVEGIFEELKREQDL